VGRTVEVKLGARSYPVRIACGLLDRVGELLVEIAPCRRAVIITDDNVRALYAARLASSLAQAQIDSLVISVPPGESSKSLETLAHLYDEFARLHVRRDELVLALGGGVIGDLAGFAAATWLRGVRFVQVPTTVLSQVDSSVGGKVGINHPSGKNLIGSFYQPLLVVIDPDTLRTLPSAEVWSGLAEVIKYGFIADRSLYERVATDIRALAAEPGSSLWEEILARCCEIKATIVQSDERDLGLRHILNFGHTLGHALEAATGYNRLRHGEAVARGMVAALWLSHWLRAFPEEELEASLQVLEQFPRPELDDLVAREIVPHVAHDKKGTSAGQKWVLLDRIGSATVIQDPPAELVVQAAEKMLR